MASWAYGLDRCGDELCPPFAGLPPSENVAGCGRFHNPPMRSACQLEIEFGRKLHDARLLGYRRSDDPAEADSAGVVVSRTAVGLSISAWLSTLNPSTRISIFSVSGSEKVRHKAR